MLPAQRGRDTRAPRASLLAVDHVGLRRGSEVTLPGAAGVPPAGKPGCCRPNAVDARAPRASLLAVDHVGLRRGSEVTLPGTAGVPPARRAASPHDSTDRHSCLCLAAKAAPFPTRKSPRTRGARPCTR